MKRVSIAAPLILLGSLLASAASGEDMAAVAKARHDHFKEIGSAMKGIGDEFKSGAPSVAKIQVYAKRINDLAPQLPTWFPVGSGPENGVKTHAKAEVWTKPDEFKKDAAAFAVEANKMNVAALGGNLSAMGAQASALGQTCKTCHQTFRERED